MRMAAHCTRRPLARAQRLLSRGLVPAAVILLVYALSWPPARDVVVHGAASLPSPATAILLPHTVMLLPRGDSDPLTGGGERPFDLASALSHPTLLDVWADGDSGCLHAISRGYRTIDLANLSVEIGASGQPAWGSGASGSAAAAAHVVDDDDVSMAGGDGGAVTFETLVAVRPLHRYAESVTHMRACAAALTARRTAAAVSATFTLGSLWRARTTLAVPAAALPAPPPAADVAVCTVVDNATAATWLAPWLAHLAAIGVGHVYCYLNVPASALASSLAALPAEVATAVAAGTLTLVHWPFPYLLSPQLLLQTAARPEWGTFRVVHFGQTTALQACGARFARAHAFLGALDPDEWPALPQPAAAVRARRDGGASAGSGSGAGGQAPATTLTSAFQAAQARGANCFCLANVWAWAGSNSAGAAAAALSQRARVALLSRPRGGGGALVPSWSGGPTGKGSLFDRAKCFLGSRSGGNSSAREMAVHWGIHHPRGAGVVCARVGVHLHMIDGRAGARAAAFGLRLPRLPAAPTAAMSRQTTAWSGGPGKRPRQNRTARDTQPWSSLLADTQYAFARAAASTPHAAASQCMSGFSN